MQNIKLVYGYDPLCGWCYAFSKEMTVVRDALPTVEIELLYGGLVMGERVGPVAAQRDYLLNGEKQLEARTGVTFGDQFKNGLLAKGTYIADSEPPCRAVWVVQQLAPQHAFAFANALPMAHYWEGFELDDPDLLCSIAVTMGVHAGQFIDLYHSQEAKSGVLDAFRLARASGLTSYPTLWVEETGTRQLLLRGWQKGELIVQHLKQRYALPG